MVSIIKSTGLICGYYGSSPCAKLYMQLGYWYTTNVTFEFLGYSFRFAGTKTLSPDRNWLTTCSNPLTSHVTINPGYYAVGGVAPWAVSIDMERLWKDGMLASSQTLRVKARGSSVALSCKMFAGAVEEHDFGNIDSGTYTAIGCAGSEGTTWHDATVYDDGSVG